MVLTYRLEESPNFTEEGLQITPAGSNPRESATENNGSLSN